MKSISSSVKKTFDFAHLNKAQAYERAASFTAQAQFAASEAERKALLSASSYFTLAALTARR